MEPAPEQTQGLWASLKRLLRTVVCIAQNRLELLLIEWQEERGRLVEAVLLAAVVAVLVLMTLVMASFTIVVIFWEDHRETALIGLTLFYLLAALGVFWRLRVRLKQWTPFSATLDELKKDKACLEEKP